MRTQISVTTVKLATLQRFKQFISFNVNFTDTAL